MAIRIVLFGSQRASDEVLRIGTVRRPPRGVTKNQYASQNWYDTWLPNRAPTAELMKLGRAVESDKDWAVLSKITARTCQMRKRLGFLICFPHCHIMQTFRWAVTARMKNGVTGPYCVNCWLNGGLNCNGILDVILSRND